MKRHSVTCDYCRVIADMQLVKKTLIMNTLVDYQPPDDWLEFDSHDFCTELCMAKFIIEKEHTLGY